MEQEEKQKHIEEEYNAYIKEVTPVFSTSKNMLHAFWTGGLVCTIGQGILHFFNSMGLDEKSAASCTTLTLIAVAILLTGFNLFSKIAKYAGAGVLVPITGFANGVASPAIEYKKEGQVFGIGCKIFTIAGPVILFGIVTSWCLGMIYWILKLTGMA
ncbi:MAG: SpoVA/SpoVAEb family sporulation membrane protein [Lachnospiraceae bacterium]|nr:SpoVA/SpoVAEb family sporulation membrane protein [Lachnospiraceae bacterium]